MKFGSITTPIVTDGLVFNMDAANRVSYPRTGTNAFNTIDMSNSGSLENGTSFTTDQQGVFILDGTDDYIDVSTYSPFTFGTGDFTISIWAYKDDAGFVPYLFDFRQNQNENAITFYTRNSIEYYINGSLILDGNSGTTIPLDSWNQLMIIRKSGTITSYINTAVDKTASDTSNLNLLRGTLIGKRFNQTTQNWPGKFGPVHIYNRALSSTEILHNYNALKSRFGL